MGFSGNYGVYHSNYDSFTWMSKYGDPSWQLHVKAAEIIGLLTLRIATSPVLPFDPTSYPYALLGYTADIASLLDSMPEMTTEWYVLYTILGKKTRAKHVSLDDIYCAIGEMNANARLLAREARMGSNSTDERKKINDLLAFSERYFLDERGTPGRTWFKHILYATG